MGFFKWINRVVFGAESVAKSAGREAVQSGKEVMDDLSQRAEELYKKGKLKVEEEFGEEDFSSDTYSAQADEDATTDSKQPGIEEDEPVGEEQNILETPEADAKEAEVKKGPQPGDKTKEFVENTGKKVLETMDEMVVKGEHLTAEGAKKWEELKAKAAVVGQDLKGKLDELIEKAEQMAREEAEEERKNPTGIREDSTHADALKGSTLSGTDDFFEKAKAFGDGDYAAASDKPIITKNSDDTQSGEDDRKVYGFEDLDGDGDEIVDDAIIDDEQE